METTTHHPPRHDSRAQCCGDAHCDSGRRNRYYVGKRMTPDALRVEQRYHLERRRLVNRAVHGWGVVYGFPLRATLPDSCAADGERRLRIGAGLAFDACGRELVQAATKDIALRDVLAFDATGCFEHGGGTCRERGAPSPWEGDDDACWLLSAHYAERDMTPVNVPDPCRCGGQEWDHVCETLVYSLRRIDCRACCAPQPCGLDCGCGGDACCDGERMREPPAEKPRQEPDGKPAERPQQFAQATTREDVVSSKEPDGADPRAPREPHGTPFARGGGRCLCEHLMRLDMDAGECDALCEVKPGLRASPGAGVPLACVKLERDRCGDWTFAEQVVDCGPRRLVKRNDLLFDLIRGCDLARIERIGWARWHRRDDAIDWQDFRTSFGDAKTGKGSWYTVRFSKPVRRATVLPDCFVMTFHAVEHREGWYEPTRAPVTRITGASEAGDPADTWREVSVEFDPGWIGDAILGTRTLFRHPVQVEIEIRGDFILDCNGQAVDANAIGLQPVPTGNGTPGGTYVSTFRVGSETE